MELEGEGRLVGTGVEGVCTYDRCRPVYLQGQGRAERGSLHCKETDWPCHGSTSWLIRRHGQRTL